MSTPAERLASLFTQYQDTGERICVADENSLFTGAIAAKRTQVETGIQAVEAALAAANPSKAEEELFKLQGVFYGALNSAGMIWRLVHVYGIFHIAGTFVGGFAAAKFALVVFDFERAPHISVLLAGVAGAMLKGIYTTISRANEEKLRRAWLVSATAGPFVGLFLAIFLHYSFAGGLAVFSGGEGAAKTMNADALIWVCLFAGLKWTWAIEKFESLSKKF